MNGLVELILCYDIQSFEDHELKFVEFGIFVWKDLNAPYWGDTMDERQIVKFESSDISREMVVLG